MEDLTHNGGRPRWRRRNIRMLQPKLGQTEPGDHNLFDTDPRLYSSGTFNNDIIFSDRLTLLTNPNNIAGADGRRADDEAISSNNLIPSRSFATDRETILPIIPQQNNFDQVELNRRLNEPHFANQSKTSSLNPINRDRLMSSERPYDSQSPWSSTTALIILLVGYIIWQCFRGKNKQRKCLDDWPTLLTPSRGRPTREGRQSGEECELQTIGMTTAPAIKDRSNNSAVLRVKCDNPNEPEVEIIQLDANASNCDASKGESNSKMASKFRTSLMKNSLVVAANRATQPRVKLISEKMKQFVDIEAQSDSQTPVTFASRLVRLVQTSRLIMRNTGPDPDEPGCELAEESLTDEKRQDGIQPNEVSGQNVEGSRSDRLEVIVHRNAEDSSSSESLLGFAGSFLEPTINPPATDGFACAASALNQASGVTHEQKRSANQLIACNSDSAQISPTNSTNRSQLNSQHNMVGPCGCPLARSKSQTSQAYCQTQAMNRLLTTSPANIRPCCSVSPSAISRHENAPHLGHHNHLHHHQQSDMNMCKPHINQSSHCAIYCGHNRAKHHYENYYDDEQEDAYRRLTASIGVQFGLAIDQQASLLPAASTTCSIACKCNSAPSRPNIITDDVVMKADLSLGDSDSGNFSMINKQRINSGSICNDSNCSLCQSSLLTAPSQQTMDMFAPQPNLDPIAYVQPPLVSRWHNRRRSTLYARQPRRMSIAGVACQQFSANGFGTNAQHFLHRASIASDGANGFHQPHHHHVARQIYPPAHFCANKKSNYSSSAGSSSGIGFSGSQCLNTPTTTGAFPYQSFTITKPLNESTVADRITQVNHHTTNEPQSTWHVINSGNLRALDSSNRASLGLTSRKFSLPVQLESKAADHLTTSTCRNDLLSNQQIDDITAKNSQISCRPLQSFNVNKMNDDIGCEIGSLSQKSAEQNRRSSQTITRQSSFWLEDSNIEPKQTINFDTSKEAELHRPFVGSTSNTTNTNESKADVHVSPPESPRSPPEDLHGEFRMSPSAISGVRHKINQSPSSSTSSPSPDFHRRQRQRLSNRTSQSSSITKKRLLGGLKQRRGQRTTSQRRSTSQTANPIFTQKQDTNSTDDEPDKTKHEDSLSSFDREVASAVSGRTMLDINSTSLERQCRDLWKLRATLHDDALIGDNWSNYHQRLNRRYDSGYKSIENQFSSSIEGNVPNVLSLSLHQAPGTVGAENDLTERPQSGCSRMIQEGTEGPSNNLVSSILNEEETQALLDNCDDQQDEQ